ncbi:serine/threonine protein kinase [European chub iridovirus]|nr:serine/threonine protein kinase [European chub iridovirus]
MHQFVALKEQGNYSFVGRCKFNQRDAIAKFTCNTDLSIKHEYDVLQSMQNYPWFPKVFTYCKDLRCFSHYLYQYKGEKEMFLMEDIGEKSLTMYQFMNMKRQRKHVMDAAIIQTLGAIGAMYNNKIVHNDLHINNIMIRPCAHDFVVYTHKKDYTVAACTPTYGVEPVIIDMGMAKHVRKDGRCAMSEYHTHLGMSISGNAMDGRFDAATFLLNVMPMYQRGNMKDNHLSSFVEHMCYNKELARPCDVWFNSLSRAICNTIPLKLLTKDTEFMLIDAAFMCRSTVPIRQYRMRSINLHFLWRNLYGIMFSGTDDPLKAVKDICITLNNRHGCVWNQASYLVKNMGKMMASLTVRINARNNKDKKKLYKNTHWQCPQEMLVLLSMMKTMQSKTLYKLMHTSDNAQILVYELDTKKTYFANVGTWRSVMTHYISRCIKAQNVLTNTASMVALMTPSPSAAEMAMHIVHINQMHEKTIARLETYKRLVLTCMYTLLALARVWTFALKMLILD